MSDRSTYKKLKVGSPALLREPSGPPAEVDVVRHGRDAQGVYTEVKGRDGMAIRVHRSWLEARP